MVTYTTHYVLVVILAFLSVGGWSAAKSRYRDAIPSHHDNQSTCGLTPANAYSLFRSPNDPDLPWPGVLFGLTISATWYFCSDQVLFLGFFGTVCGFVC